MGLLGSLLAGAAVALAPQCYLPLFAFHAVLHAETAIVSILALRASISDDCNRDDNNPGADGGGGPPTLDAAQVVGSDRPRGEEKKRPRAYADDGSEMTGEEVKASLGMLVWAGAEAIGDNLAMFGAPVVVAVLAAVLGGNGSGGAVKIE